jgi:hypothetical protein
VDESGFVTIVTGGSASSDVVSGDAAAAGFADCGA